MSRAAAWLRLSAADVAITIAIFAWALAEAVAIEGDRPTWLRVGFALAAAVPMVARNRAPAATFAVALGAFLVDVVFEVLPLQAVTPLQLLPLTTYALASLGPDRRVAGLVSVVAIGLPPALVTALAVDAPVTLADVLSLLVLQTVSAGAGWAVRRRREEADASAARAQSIRAGGDDVVRAGLDAERARIARDLRAIVARGVAAMDARFAAAAGASGSALAEIAADLQRRCAAVMGDLQRLLGVLHDAEPGVAEPVSAAAALAAAAARGWEVVAEPLAEAAPGGAMAAGRVIEEVLAGAPPGGGEAVHAELALDGGVLVLRLAGRGPAAPALVDPVALSSLRERVRLHGGTIRLRRRPRGWAVEVRLPTRGAALPPTGPPEVVGDAIVMVTAAVVVLGDASAATATSPALFAALGLVLFVLPLALRRRWPVAVVLVSAGALLLLELTGLLPNPARLPIIVALLGAGVAAMHVGDRRLAILSTAIVAASAVTVDLAQRPRADAVTDVPIILFVVAMAYVFGQLVRDSLARTRDAHDAGEHGAAHHAARLSAAVEAERRAVARDLHDVVAHGVSLAGVLAGGAQAQAVSDPARAQASLASARETVAQVEVEVERLTAALGADAADGPPVDLADLEGLVGAARRGGQEVTLTFEPAARAATPASVGASVYRIVQESLTNARKYAPQAPVTVTVGLEGRLLVVRVANTAPPGAAPPGALEVGTGRGLPGMRERARLLGGELTAEASVGGFAVTARLPVGTGVVPR